MSATDQIYRGAGLPPMQGKESGVCRTCGGESIGLLFSEWVRDTFTDRDKLLPGEIICHACLFCFAEQSELLAKKVGKDKPQRMRNYSHFVMNGEWFPLSKGDKARMRELLLISPQVVIIADSGQRHIAFRARRGWWQFEEQAMLPCPALLESLLEPVESLYQVGASKSEIESGHYSQKSIQAIGVANFLRLDGKIKNHRGSLSLKLALFLAQKESEDGA